MLTGKQRRRLRGLGHSLAPVVLIGKGDVSEALLKEIDTALAAHELIKVKLLESCLLDRYLVAEDMANATSAEVAQVMGRTILLYRQGEKAKIEL